jgi:hypothetical protein
VRCDTTRHDPLIRVPRVLLLLVRRQGAGSVRVVSGEGRPAVHMLTHDPCARCPVLAVAPRRLLTSRSGVSLVVQEFGALKHILARYITKQTTALVVGCGTSCQTRAHDATRDVAVGWMSTHPLSTLIVCVSRVLRSVGGVASCRVEERHLDRLLAGVHRCVQEEIRRTTRHAMSDDRSTRALPSVDRASLCHDSGLTRVSPVHVCLVQSV